MECIAYKTGYKYQLVNEYSTSITISPGEDITSEYIHLSAAGEIIIKKGYAWDGPSGPTIDTLNFMRGSLVHDALYQLMRQQKLSKEKYRKPADELLRKMCIEDGMTSVRAWWVYRGVRLGGGSAADPGNKKQIIKAPKACQ